jgi:hypothetical protein
LALSIRAIKSRVVDFPKASASGLRIGDTVRTGENRYPQYAIIAISGERAWIRNVQYGDDHVVPIATIHKI